MIKPLHYLLTLGIFSLLLSCKDENQFVLEENKADIEQIITAVIEYDSLNFQKHNKDSIAVAESFKKITIIKEDDDILPVFLGENEISLQTLYSLNETSNSGEAINFNKKDSLYLLSQNEIKDTIKLPQNILKNSNVLTKKQKENWHHHYNVFYEFDFPIISKDKTKAYLQLGHHCGGGCGSGVAYFLHKKNGKWQIVFRDKTWIK